MTPSYCAPGLFIGPLQSRSILGHIPSRGIKEEWMTQDWTYKRRQSSSDEKGRNG